MITIYVTVEHGNDEFTEFTFTGMAGELRDTINDVCDGNHWNVARLSLNGVGIGLIGPIDDTQMGD